MIMGKEKTKSGNPNKHLHARISFLQQAATYLAQHTQNEEGSRRNPPSRPNNSVSEIVSDNNIDETDSGSAHRVSNTGVTLGASDKVNHTGRPFSLGPAARLNSHLMQISRKSQIRLDPGVKHQICKRCHNLLLTEPSADGLDSMSSGVERNHHDGVLKGEIAYDDGLKARNEQVTSTAVKYMTNESKGSKKSHADVLVLECRVCGAEKRWPLGARKQVRSQARKERKVKKKLQSGWVLVDENEKGVRRI